jgi:manganese/zinc/iron transport system substrate-binding protein
MLLVILGCHRENSEQTKVVGSSPSNASQVTSQPRAVATVGMVADLVKQVAGDQWSVGSLMGPGVDPHLHKPTRDDFQALKEADVIFYGGLMLEGKLVDTLDNFSKSKPVYALTDWIERKKLIESEEFHGQYDPHVWMDIDAWSDTLEPIAKVLGDLDPANAQAYLDRATTYRSRLLKLHDYGREVIASIPDERRWLITSHDAFHYLGRAYGLEVLGVQGISTASEAGLQQINRLVDLIVDHRIPAVFIESSVSEKSIHSLLEGAKSRNQAVVIGGELFSDAMGLAGSYEGTYEGMMDHNLTTIGRALGGMPSERGLHGKLSLETHERKD